MINKYINLHNYIINMNKQELSTDVSRDFWKNQDFYPEYGDVIKKRRLIETSFLTNWIWENNPKNMSDIGCGNGSTVTMLQELTGIYEYYCYDISDSMLEKLDGRNVRGASIYTNVVDLCNLQYDFIETDLTAILGVTMYLTDLQFVNLLQKVQSKTVIIRDPISKTREEINKFSEDLNFNYSAIYRTLDEYIKLLGIAGWNVKLNKRAYPDEIESKFGTKQYFFVCEKK